jgi:sialic acid synthase
MDSSVTNRAPASAARRTCMVVAEVGCNHMGDLAIAKKIVDVASSFCEVRHVKFQKRNPKVLLSHDQYGAPHPVPENAFGPTYGAHREYLEFDLDQHRELKAYCDSRDVIYSCSVWDMPSLHDIMSLKPLLIKVPSATNTNTELLETLGRKFPGQIHLSLGMTTRAEEAAIIGLFRKAGRARDLMLYACTSGYPIQPREACLMEIVRLRETYGESVGGIGYSGHHNGIALDIAAFTLGAEMIERHFTLDRTWKGTDHAASLEPDGLRRLKRNLEYTAEALAYKPTEILAVESPQREKLKWLHG